MKANSYGCSCEGHFSHPLGVEPTGQKVDRSTWSRLKTLDQMLTSNASMAAMDESNHFRSVEITARAIR